MPFRNGSILKSRVRSLWFALVSFAVLVCVSGLIIKQEGFARRISPQTPLYVQTARRDRQWTLEHTRKDVPENLAKLGDTDTGPRLLVWGDSHAMAVLPAIDALCSERKIGAVAATHSSTLPVKDYFQNRGDGLKERSIPFNDAVINYVQTARIDAVLMVACGWNGHFSNSDCLEATLETADILREAGASVYLMDTVPTFSYDVAKFTGIYSNSGRLAELKISLADYIERQALTDDALLKLKQRGIRVLKPMDLLFNEKHEFLPYDSGGSYYRDSAHLSSYGAIKLQPLFEPIFDLLDSQGGYTSPRLAGEFRPENK